MAHLTDLQCSALQSAQILLDNVGLSPHDLDSTLPLPSLSHSPTPSILEQSTQSSSSLSSPPSSSTSPCLTVLGACYNPPAAQPFIPDDWLHKCHHFTRKSTAHASIEHPLGAIVEYPQTGDAPDQSIAHIFNINPSTFHSSQHPKANFQYSLGDVHGGCDVSKCLMLRDGQGQPVSCSNLKTYCKGLKICSARPHDTTTHHFTNILEVSSLIIATTTAAKSVNNAEKEVFQKTFAFFVALNQHGCTFDAELNSDTSENHDVTDITNDTADDTEDGLTPDQYLDKATLNSDLDYECSPLS
ncbi:uncharacterized protein BJ212DRAFT_1474984 [Suillus subaureus]|uniref:Uncharacterized protein n=1 Tax=Suillus subaureus TaxID=48587 RepID=A0A9P7EM40_9AGAM|nr:uncharacterized protein BJ212DRAFT_1474984 [Suillus subaureus]KAG1825588.1 hypothetical protein BJ212DRAFT_1474984 [Suillus subaureus]